MYLLDTNHCSLILLKNQTIFDCLRRVGETNIATTIITIITVGELTFMAENSKYQEQNLINLRLLQLAILKIIFLDIIQKLIVNRKNKHQTQ